ncbi:hypothetical protein [Pseudofrankia saprophytica]|nr:hypothetical protein [Pseudofrankia saprophytica]
MAGFQDFLASWEEPGHPRNLEAVSLQESRFGNISETGELGNYRGHALSRWHPKFRAALEPGIRPLVVILAERLGYITYTSCEGHSYPETVLAPVERHIGLYPRDGAERQAIVALLSDLSRAVNQVHRSEPVRISVVEHRLETELDTREVVSWFFARARRAPWPSYFAALRSITEQLQSELDARSWPVDAAITSPPV